MYRYDIYIQDMKVETFDVQGAETMFQASVLAGSRAKELCKLRGFSKEAASLDYKGYFPKPATEIVVSTAPPKISNYWS